MTELAGAELEAIGIACHLEGHYARALDAYERAHAAYRQEGDALAAARSARTIGWFKGWIFGDWAVHRGWADRARTLLESASDGTRHEGWLLLDAARHGRDLEVQRGQYEDVIALARASADPDLECEAQASLGMMLVFSGLVDEGMRHLDQALAGLCAGEVEELPVIEGCLCGLFNACERTLDLPRAEQWLRAADELISRRRLVAVAGYCRAHYAGILIAAGRWSDADAELVDAIDALPTGSAIHGAVLCRLANLRIRQGRLEEAATLLSGLDQHEDVAPPLAALHLARGTPELARETVERALAGELEDHAAAPLLALAVDAQLAAGDLAAAAGTCERLADIAANQVSAFVRATAAVAASRVAEASGAHTAVDSLRAALSLFAEAKMPFELARTRLALARSLSATRPEVAIAEASAALATFAALGAAPDADAAAALLRALGAPARTGPKGGALLTKREQEVLDLLSHGLSNAAIAERLFISAKTVEHHVGRILAKLGVRSRAEAAVHALRSDRPQN